MKKLSTIHVLENTDNHDGYGNLLKFLRPSLSNTITYSHAGASWGQNSSQVCFYGTPTSSYREGLQERMRED